MRNRTSLITSSSTAFALIALSGLALSAHAGPTGGGHRHGQQGAPIANVEHGVPVAIEAPPIAATDGPIIQLAILLDTSNSMDGLITQAKTRLWSIVNELSRARHDGVVPQLQVALYEYGNDGIESSQGHIRQRVAFTTDLDILSEQLFSLTTNGGSEFCGWVIDDAVRELGWIATDVVAPDGDPETTLEEAADSAFRDAMGNHPSERATVPLAPDQAVVRMVVIAGNEPFTQGSVHFRESIAKAVEAGVIINTIHCGSHAEGAQTGWKEGALLGNGRYTSIDQNRSVVEVASPYDDELRKLSVSLNGTYVPYGESGQISYDRQSLQDTANEAVGAGMSRAASKASALYVNTSWDLVDAIDKGTVILADVEADDLPEDMREMSVDERVVHIDGLRIERLKIQSQIKDLSADRASFIVANTPDDPEATSLHEAILTMLRVQCEAQGFVFEESPKIDE